MHRAVPAGPGEFTLDLHELPYTGGELNLLLTLADGRSAWDVVRRG
ncbi:hypothetical protein ACLF5H_29195 [Streptomyces sp. LaBMicrA B280]